MTHPFRSAALALLGVGALLSGCASNAPSGIQVTRFHLGQPIPADTIAVTPAPGIDAGGLEFRTLAASVATELATVGFRAGTPAAYTAILKYEQSSRPAPRRGGLSIGLGGGSFGGGGGVGGGVSVPVGQSRPGELRTTLVTLDIRRTSDKSTIWEGRATQDALGDNPAASLPVAVPTLARAMLKNFPGQTGATVTVKP